MNFREQYEAYLAPINQEIELAFAVPKLLQKQVFEAMSYGISGGGKRIRPVLTMAVCHMLEGDLSDAAKVGCAIEAVHSYSLIHDDLPCMDDDAVRRGKPSCHKAYGEDIALLAGDGLLNRAFELLSDSERYTTLTAEGQLKVMETLSKASGVFGMIGGQVIDLACENQENVELETLLALHRGKTGELIRAAAVCGCHCAGILDEKDEKIQKIMKFSVNLGLAFQIKDDILDVMGNEAKLGKPVGSDVQQNKTTFVTLMGMEAAEQELIRLTAAAKEALDGLENTAFLLEFADYLLHRDS